jgi:G3E family GTPase
MFSLDRALEVDVEFLKDDQDHKHDSRIGTFSYNLAGEMSLEGANEFIRKIVMENGANIYRMKGFLAIEGQPLKYVFHSVGMIFSIKPYIEWKEDEDRHCVFVIIGKNLQQKWLEDQFKNAKVKSYIEVINEAMNKILGK